MTNEDFLERIACELTALNTTLNSRFDALDEISCGIHLMREDLTNLYYSINDLSDKLNA